MGACDSMRRYVAALLSGLVLTLVTGCPVVSNLPAPGRCLTERDPEHGRRYHLYVPSAYHDGRSWPLVVTCHGTPPFDTAQAQFDEWKGLAELRGFLLVAPELVGTRGDLTPLITHQVGLQMEDEEAILAIVHAIQAGYRIDPPRIFLTGWSGGGYAVLHTGLRNPHLFRALAVRQGNFDPRFVESCVPFLDRHQPIQVTIGHLDVLLHDQGLACIEWLRSHGLDPMVVERSGAHRRDPEPVLAFFVDVVRNRPWIRVLVTDDASDPMRVRLQTQTSFDAQRFLWDFGDDSERSPLPHPEHRYEKPGLYTVRVALWPAEGGPLVRQIPLQVPRIRLGVATTTTAP